MIILLKWRQDITTQLPKRSNDKKLVYPKMGQTDPFSKGAVEPDRQDKQQLTLKNGPLHSECFKCCKL